MIVPHFAWFRISPPRLITIPCILAPQVIFEFYPLRFEFIARDSILFPPGKAANILRGAFGEIFRRLACVPHCRDARTCEIRESCPYATVFEPLGGDNSPSGLADSPRPFVFRARHLDGHIVQPGQPFYFDLNVFTRKQEVLAYFVLTFSALAREGLGPKRGKADLQLVRSLAVGASPERIVFDKATQLIAGELDPAALDLSAIPDPAPTAIRIDFLSPTELKHDQKIVERPEFSILFGRIRDRISTLRRLYGTGPLEIDFQETNRRAAAVRMTRCDLHREDAERRSSRTGQSHPIGGFVGSTEYEGDLAEFLPYLNAARWVGVGRQAVWGKGEISAVPPLGQA